MPNFSDLYGVGGVKSVQRGVANVAGGAGVAAPVYIDVTISPVVMSKTACNLQVFRSGGSSAFLAGLELISSTVLRVTFSLQAVADGKWYGQGNCPWELVEWN